MIRAAIALFLAVLAVPAHAIDIQKVNIASAMLGRRFDQRR